MSFWFRPPGTRRVFRSGFWFKVAFYAAVEKANHYFTEAFWVVPDHVMAGIWELEQLRLATAVESILSDNIVGAFAAKKVCVSEDHSDREVNIWTA